MDFDGEVLKLQFWPEGMWCIHNDLHIFHIGIHRGLAGQLARHCGRGDGAIGQLELCASTSS